MAPSKVKSVKKRKQELLDEHQTVTMSIALQAIRINEMQKVLSSQSDRILQLETEIETLDAEENGGGLN